MVGEERNHKKEENKFDFYVIKFVIFLCNNINQKFKIK